MKAIKQLQFKLSLEDYERYSEFLPYAWVSFNPDDLECYSSTILIFDTKEAFLKNEGYVSYISDDITDSLFEYKCTPKF